MTRRGALALGLLGAVVILSRVPFATHELWAWDSVLYARALDQGFHVDVDLSGQRPHPPGYILYLALAWLFQRVLVDANAALVMVSIAASGVGAVAVYLLARRWARASVAAIAALGYAANPLVWTYGEVAYPYALLGALAVVLARAMWHARATPRAAATLAASVAFGLLSGFRQDLLVLLGPLWLWMVWPRPARERALAAALVAAGVAVWLAPTAALSDGFGGYAEALMRQSAYVGDAYSVPSRGIDALWSNLRFTLYALAWGLLGFGVMLVGLALAAVLASARARSAGLLRRLDGSRGFFVAWLGPGLLVYVFVHIGEWGYVLSILPALYVVAAVLVDRLVARLRPAARLGWRGAAAALALAPALIFLGTTQRFSAATLHQHDAALRARVEYVRAHFAADRTIVLAREDFLLVRYYLPEYRAWLYDPAPHGTEATMRKRAMRTTTIVIFTAGLTPRQSLDVRYVEVATGVHLAYVTVEPGAVLEFYGSRYTVREPQ